MKTRAHSSQSHQTAAGSPRARELSNRASRVLIALALISSIAAGAPLESPRQAAIKLVAQIQRADYEGDLAALRRLYLELAPLVDDKETAARIRYWRGFAMWRRAINGFNDNVARSEQEQDLRLAVSEFEEALRQASDFVDAKVGKVSCLGYLAYLYRDDVAHVRELIGPALPLIKEAEAADSENPRLTWVKGPGVWNAPPERGGGPDKAIESYQKALPVARARKAATSDPLTPSWGEPELHMSLAWSFLNRSIPDIAAAEQHARAALAIVPYWHYVRDILLPQIEAAKK